MQAVLDMMTDDATWWLNGRTDLYPDAATRTKAQMADAWRSLYDLLDGGLTMDPLAMLAEGDRVAAEVRSHAVTKAGKIAAVREYTDLLHAAAVFA